MKLIMENWRQWLGLASAKMHPKIKEILNAIVEDTNVSVIIKEKVDAVEIFYGDPETLEPSSTPEGLVEMRLDPWGNGPCLDAYVVSWTRATSGWGPLLYEVAIEWASRNASGLAPDRHSVSDDALGVWIKYAQRPDLDQAQLDIDLEKTGAGQLGKAFKPSIDQGELSQLTPDDPSDDCVQISALQQAKQGGGWHEEWEDSPLSQLYSKPTQEVTTALKKAGRLVVV